MWIFKEELLSMMQVTGFAFLVTVLQNLDSIDGLIFRLAQFFSFNFGDCSRRKCFMLS